MKERIRAGIVGGAGYTGGEAIRLLLNHPNAELVFVHSRSNAGNTLYSVHADLQGDTALTFTDTLRNDVDVVFLCLGHGESKKFLLESPFPASVKIIDLSQDFRLGDTLPDRKFVYGLPELNKEAIRKADNIANPGCFATTIELGLLPLAGGRFAGRGIYYRYYRLYRGRTKTAGYNALYMARKQYIGVQDAYASTFERDQPVAQTAATVIRWGYTFCALAW